MASSPSTAPPMAPAASPISALLVLKPPLVLGRPAAADNNESNHHRVCSNSNLCTEDKAPVYLIEGILDHHSLESSVHCT